MLEGSANRGERGKRMLNNGRLTILVDSDFSAVKAKKMTRKVTILLGFHFWPMFEQCCDADKISRALMDRIRTTFGG